MIERAHGSLFSAFVLLAIVGTVLPLAYALPWIGEHGFAPASFIADMFANPIAGATALDIIVTAGTAVLFILVQGARDSVGHRWLPILLVLTVGVSSGLPLFLAMRERAVGRVR